MRESFDFPVAAYHFRLNFATGDVPFGFQTRACEDSSRIYDGCCEVDHRFEAAIGFARAHGDTLELFELAEEVLDEMPPFIDLCVDLAWHGSAGMLRNNDLGAALIEVSDDGIAIKGLVGKQRTEPNAIDKR